MYVLHFLPHIGYTKPQSTEQHSNSSHIMIGPLYDIHKVCVCAVTIKHLTGPAPGFGRTA